MSNQMIYLSLLPLPSVSLICVILPELSAQAFVRIVRRQPVSEG